MKNPNPTPTLTSPIGRTFIYLSIFTAGSAVHELLSHLIHPTLWSTNATVLTLLTLIAFILAGVLFACERHTMSRVVSAATLFILGLVALRIGHSVVPDSYLFVVALCIAAIGARPFLHRKLTNGKQTILYSLLTIVITLVIAVTFAYGMTVLDRIAVQQYGTHN
jgi:hypothetical protein